MIANAVLCLPHLAEDAGHSSSMIGRQPFPVDPFNVGILKVLKKGESEGRFQAVSEGRFQAVLTYKAPSLGSKAETVAIGGDGETAQEALESLLLVMAAMFTERRTEVLDGIEGEVAACGDGTVNLDFFD